MRFTAFFLCQEIRNCFYVILNHKIVYAQSVSPPDTYVKILLKNYFPKYQVGKLTVHKQFYGLE